MGNSKLDFEEMSTVLAQIEACLNSRPLSAVPTNDDDGIEMLTPGHFLIGRPLQALPDHAQSFQKQSLLRRWYLCQSLVRHFWERWRNEYRIAPKFRDKNFVIATFFRDLPPARAASPPGMHGFPAHNCTLLA